MPRSALMGVRIMGEMRCSLCGAAHNGDPGITNPVLPGELRSDVCAACWQILMAAAPVRAAERRRADFERNVEAGEESRAARAREEAEKWGE